MSLCDYRSIIPGFSYEDIKQNMSYTFLDQGNTVYQKASRTEAE